MSARAHFQLSTLIIGSAIAGAFVLGAVFGHLKPWQRKEPTAEVKEILKYAAQRAPIPRVLARCIAAGTMVPEVPSDPYDDNGDRRAYVMACMRGEGFEYDISGKMLGGIDCSPSGYHQSYREENCYRPGKL
jgi:hypothetical protein